jgi:PPOX class probable F420-dependent enzyme
VKGLVSTINRMLETIDPEIMSNGTGVLATIDAQGRPQLTAVWFIVSDDHLRISINAKRQKARNLAANGAVSFLVYHPASQDFFAEIRGNATLIADGDYALSAPIAAKYHADFRTFDQPGDSRFIIDITPSRVLVTDERH